MKNSKSGFNSDRVSFTKEIERLEKIENDPKQADLVARAKNPDARPSTFKRVAKVVRSVAKSVLGLAIAEPKDFHGTAIVTKDLENHSRLTAGTVSVSSAFNGVTNMSLLIYAFKSMGSAGVPMALAANILILIFTNKTASAASGVKKGNRPWVFCATGAMILANLLQSIVAGVGTELMLNQSGLSQILAEQSIQGQTEGVEALKKPSPEYLEAQKRCQEGERELAGIPKSDPRWESLYVRLHGTWAERDTDWSQKPLDRLPLCRKLDPLQQESYKTYNNAKAILDEKLLVRQELGNDLAFLKRELPLLHEQQFLDDGEIRSGIEASRMAIYSFLNKLQTGDWAGLGFPLFFLLLSLFFSGGAVAMTIAHARREDTQMSFDDDVARERDRWLNERRRELRRALSESSKTNP
ncbi:MAG: hypothetical protein SWY16_24640 [Cyanobacteriota bacterium]|nr:hypothetical protein [Cyanobacteriota bacterium]